MKAKNKVFSFAFAAVLAAVMLACFCGCSAANGQSNVMSLRETGLEGITAEQLAGITELDLRDGNVADIAVLKECSELRVIDLRGNNISAEQYEELQAALPECKIIWDVSILGEAYDSTTKKLVLEGENDDSLDNIKYLNDLVYCNLLKVTGTDDEEINELQSLLPNAEIVWNIKLGRGYVRSDIKEYTYSSYNGTDLSSLKYCRKLESVDLRRSDDSVNFAVLAGIPTLRTLSFSNSNITDFSDVSLFTGITKLSFYETSFNDLSLISNLTNLEELSFGSFIEAMDVAENLDAIKNLTSLKTLSADNAGITDISALKGMTELESLSIAGNPIEDFTPLAGLTKLRLLDLTNTLVSDLGFLKKLTNIDTLYLGGINPELSAAGYAPKSLGKCRIEDFSPIADLVNIENLIIVYTDMSDISFVSGLKSAQVISIDNNKITDPSPLYELERVEQVDLYKNPISKADQEAVIENMPNTVVLFDDLFF